MVFSVRTEKESIANNGVLGEEIPPDNNDVDVPRHLLILTLLQGVHQRCGHTDKLIASFSVHLDYMVSSSCSSPASSHSSCPDPNVYSLTEWTLGSGPTKDSYISRA